MLLAAPAYASALILGLPIHLLLRKRGLRSLGYYAGIGAAVGLTSVAIVTVMETVVAWNWSPDNVRALSLWKYSGRYIVIAALYAAVASAAFWVIAVRQPRPAE
jgi:hypothetical protein